MRAIFDVVYDERKVANLMDYKTYDPFKSYSDEKTQLGGAKPSSYEFKNRKYR